MAVPVNVPPEWVCELPPPSVAVATPVVDEAPLLKLGRSAAPHPPAA